MWKIGKKGYLKIYKFKKKMFGKGEKIKCKWKMEIYWEHTLVGKIIKNIIYER